MRPELQKGKLEGVLVCPNEKCGREVGRYAWFGSRCACGGWEVPGISVLEAEVHLRDEGARKDVSDGVVGEMGREVKL